MAVDRRYVMGVVTVITGGVGPRLVLDTGPGVNRAHIALDLFNHHAQAGIIAVSAGLLRLFPEILVALNTTHLAVDPLPVGRLDDVLVAIHTIPAAVHTLLKLFRRYVKIAFLPVFCLSGKIFLAVAFQAALIAQLGIRWFGKHRCAEWQQQSRHQEHGDDNSYSRHDSI